MFQRSLGLPAAVVWLFLALHTAALLGVSSQTQSTAADILALTHARVIDGTGAAPLADQTLIIDGGRIRALGATSVVAIPAGARTRDLTGRTIMPGLIMLHEHMEWLVGTTTHVQAFSAPRLFLACGVTTIRTAGTDHPYVELNLKRQIDEGRAIGPEVFVTSPFLNGPGNVSLGDNIVRNAEDARRAVGYWAAEGVSSIKVYQHISKRSAERNHLRSTSRGPAGNRAPSIGHLSRGSGTRHR
jgi:hypothetical protein